MRIPNLLNFQSLNRNNIIRLVFILSVLFIGVSFVNLDIFGYSLLRSIFTFIYITFIPGFLLLRVFKFDKLDNNEVILFSIGLSIASLMFLGLGLNFIGIYLSVLAITLNKLVIAILGFTSLLAIIIYLRETNSVELIDYIDIPIKYILMSLLLIGTSFLGVYYLYYYSVNIVLILLYLLISLIPIFIIFRFNDNKYFFATLIFSIALSLLFNRTLLSTYISGWDIQKEYYLSSLVINNSFWNSMLSYDYNGMLSVVMLAPIYSIILNIDLVWVFKLIYPLLFSLVPCCMYFVFKKQFNDKVAFLSCSFIIFVYTFYLEMPALARQEIAEVFFVFVIYLMLNKSLNKGKKSLLIVIFLASLSVSHYGLSYFAIYFFVFMLFAEAVLESNLIKKYIYRIREPVIRKTRDYAINLYIVFYFIIITVTWNLYIASSVTIEHIVNLSNRFITALLNDFLNPSSSQGLSILLNQPDEFLHLVTRYMNYFAIFLISIGILYLLINYHKLEINNEFKALSLANYILCIAGIILPFVSSALDTTRLFHISTLTLAPYVVLGSQSLVNIFKLISKVQIDVRTFSLKIVAIFLCVFMLFNSGWVYEVTGDHPTSYLLNNSIDTSIFNEGEVTGARYWNNMRAGQSIYGDLNRWLLLESINLNGTIAAYYRYNSTDPLSIPSNTFIYLGTYNIKTNRFFMIDSPDINFVSTSTATFNSSKVYSDLYCDIYFK